MNHQILVDSFSLIAQADSIRRYSRDRTSIPESVLAHTGWCATWLVFIGKKAEQDLSVSLDWGTLLTRCVVHDLDEIGTGDIPRTTKHATPELSEQLDALGSEFVMFIEQRLGLERWSLAKDWAQAKNMSSLEGVLMKYADMAAVVYKVWDEIVRTNNYSFIRVAHEIRGYLDDLTLEGGLWHVRTVAWFEDLRRSLLLIVDQALHVCAGRGSQLGPIDFNLSPKG